MARFSCMKKKGNTVILFYLQFFVQILNGLTSLFW